LNFQERLWSSKGKRLEFCSGGLNNGGDIEGELTRHDVLVAESDTKRLALKDEVIVLLGAQPQAVVLAVPKGEADGASIGIDFVACHRKNVPSAQRHTSPQKKIGSEMRCSEAQRAEAAGRHPKRTTAVCHRAPHDARRTARVSRESDSRAPA